MWKTYHLIAAIITIMTLTPIVLMPLLWPAYIFDSQMLMAVLCVPLSVFNIVLLLNVLPAWRRATILSDSVEDEMDMETDVPAELVEERTSRIAAEASGFTSYNAYVKAKERLQK